MAKLVIVAQKEPERKAIKERTPEEALRRMKPGGQEMKERMTKHGRRTKNPR